jgi:hypothetical protein
MMKARAVVRIVFATLCGAFLAVYIAAKIHFFTRYDPLRVGAYIHEHRIYWGAMAGIAFLIWLVEKLFPERPS